MFIATEGYIYIISLFLLFLLSKIHSITAQTKLFSTSQK